MTDTLNVPREWLKRLDYFLQMTGVPSTHRERKTVRSMLAAAPKAEPIGRNITFSPNAEGVGNAVVSADVPEGPYWTLIGVGGDDEQNRIAAEIVRRLNAERPEAPKVEQEPCPERGMGVCDCSQCHPAPAIDELLEAAGRALKYIDACAEVGEFTPNDEAENPCDIWNDLNNAIAKHKGPQS